jgi:hypothetical protein
MVSRVSNESTGFSSGGIHNRVSAVTCTGSIRGFLQEDTIIQAVKNRRRKLVFIEENDF